MVPLTVAAECQPGEGFTAAIESFAASALVSAIYTAGQQPVHYSSVAGVEKIRPLNTGLFSRAGISRLLESTTTAHLLLLVPGGLVPFPGDRTLERMLGVATDSGAGFVYSDFTDDAAGASEL